MMSRPIILHLDQSNSWSGLFFECDGQPVPLENALENGFIVSREDAPAAATLLEKFVKSRDENQK